MPLPLPALGALALSGLAAAAPPATALGPDGWAVIIGSNRPGPGQGPLQWAGEDARRVEAVFTELGGLDPAHVITLTDPDPADVRAALREIGDALAQRDDPGAVLFYYSGHARASGLDLGGQALPLADLRAALDALPARVRLVVLDACQAGAVSGVKGVAPAAAFSTGSVSGLAAEGTAVIASSTGTELSQESNDLQGSYFTHHLVTGLRGAADRDGDRTVTLDEAYAYAYDRTLVSTAGTAVGRQHATLETDLRGRGAVALTRTDGARARLTLGPADAGEILLVDDASGVVAAEVSKVEGDALTLGLPAGDYTVWWTRGARKDRCRLTLNDGQTNTFAPVGCRRIQAVATVSKGEAEDARVERFAVELGVGGLRTHPSAYTARLQDFGFVESAEWFGEPTAHASFVWSASRWLALVGTVGDLENGHWDREIISGDPDATDDSVDFSWSTTRFSALLRAQAPMLDGWLVPYAQAGGGPAWSVTTYDDPTEDLADTETFVGWHLAGAAGLQIVPVGKKGWRHIGVFGQYERSWAPVVKNLLDETHDSGGGATTFGLRFSL